MSILSGRLKLLAAILFGSLMVGPGNTAEVGADTALTKMVGQPVDIAASAYQYRADRPVADNPPESWIALLWYAHQPLNKPVDLNSPAIGQVLQGWLWEEIRPVKQLELTWETDARRPAPGDLTVTTLQNQGASSSWWNNLLATPATVKPTLSPDGKTLVYPLGLDTCGIVLSVKAGKAADYAPPSARVLVADTWKQMEVEVEWGFSPAAASQDFSGRVETYDGRVAGLQSLTGNNPATTVGTNSWRSSGEESGRRGVKFSLAYQGTSKWRPVQPFISQPEDVARTIVTLWTKGGNFSFLAADLENGPILAPEYGFFVRRVDGPSLAQTSAAPDPRVLFTRQMKAIAGSPELLGWGDDSTPWFGGNPSGHEVSVQGITFPARSLGMHPGPASEVAVGWRSPFSGKVQISARMAHGQTCGNGIEWWISHSNPIGRTNLAHGTTDGKGGPAIPAEASAPKIDDERIELGDLISLVIGPKGDHSCDTTLIELVITEVGGSGRVWNLTREVVGNLLAGNPQADALGNPDTWQFYSEKPNPTPSLPPVKLASSATTAREFMQELQSRKLSSIRQQTRAHKEQTWEGAVTGLRGNRLPPIPPPPAGTEPVMQVELPSKQLMAQWNLGAWHLLRHCEKNPQNGRLWFNDFPYGILGAETYMVLRALDLLGAPAPAADGFDQWLSLPLDPNSTGHHAWALPDRPNGLFSEGHGCLTHAVGPPGVGGQMDGIHAFGPGSIGWALTEHFWMTGDTNWLLGAAPRLKANAEWMLRQRRLMRSVLPGGERLWCKGLQPALQVTPDSGGLWMQFYECEAYYEASVSRLAATLAGLDPVGGRALAAEAEAYRRDLRAAVERSIALSPVVPTRDGTYHSVIPFACYSRGLATGAWGWRREGSGTHVGPLYWETVQSAAALISPAGLLDPQDVRVQGYLDVLEDRLLLENENVGERDWFLAGWQYQGGLERTSNMHLDGDDIPVFLRSFLNCYAIDLLPNDGYIFNEHAVHGPPDKIFEEAAFLERFRNLLVMEEGSHLWLARATPREWLEQGRKIAVKNAPTHFGLVDYQIISDVAHGTITAQVKMPTRNPAEVWLRVRHPDSARIKSVKVNGSDWKAFDPAREVVKLLGYEQNLKVEIKY